VFDNGQSNIVPVSAGGRTARHPGQSRFSGNGGFPALSALGTPHAECPASGVHPRSGRPEMDKFETIAFTVGFVATGFMALVASVPLA
jgi:hypothetical protein